jgi:hypothetical protein
VSAIDPLELNTILLDSVEERMELDLEVLSLLGS